MKKSLTILLLSCAAGVSAQDNPGYALAYGTESPYELAETRYPFDPEAEAAVLFDYGEYRFIPYESGIWKGLMLRMEFTTKIKIYNEAGLEYAMFEIPYYSPGDAPERVDIEGMTCNLENGQVVRTELSKSNIFTERVNDDWSVKKIAFPNVRAGSVIQLRYTIETRYFFQMRDWRFQNKIPVYHSRIAYRATPFYNYAYIARGLKKFDEQKTTNLPGEHRFDRFTYREAEAIFGMKRLPAFRDEEFLLNTDDYMANIKFQLSDYMSFVNGSKVQVMSTWPDLCRDLLNEPEFGKYLSASESAAKKILPQLSLEGKNDLEKFEAISEYVKYNYVWNGVVSKYAVKKLSDFQKEKSGNSANMNLFMVGLLRAAGLNAQPVVVSTHSNGLIYKSYPFITSFDDVVAMAMIDGEPRFADASVSLTRYDELPRRSTNVEGLIVTKKEPRWVYLPQNTESSELTGVKMKIAPAEGRIDAEMMQTLEGYEAWRKRSRYNGDIENLKDEYKNHEGMSITGLEVENYNETREPFVIKMTYTLATDAGDGNGTPDKLYINPLRYLAPAVSPFKQPRRTHPVNLVFTTLNNYQVDLEIPEGYEIEYLPADFSNSGDVMTVACKAILEGNTIRVRAGFSMADYYAAKDYPALKAIYESMVRAFSEVIILRKKEAPLD